MNRRNVAIVYETRRPGMPEERDIDDAELALLAANPKANDIFIYGDLITGEGVLGHRCLKTGRFENWVTPGLAGDTGARVIPIAAVRMLVALIRAGRSLTAQEAYARANPQGPPVSAFAARTLLNQALTAIDTQLKPGVRVSVLRIPGRGEVQARYSVHFGWAAAMAIGARVRPLKVCVLLVERLVAYNWARAPRDGGPFPMPKTRRSRRENVELELELEPECELEADESHDEAPRKRRRRKKASDVAEPDFAPDGSLEQIVDDDALLRGLLEGKVYRYSRTESLSFRKEP